MIKILKILKKWCLELDENDKESKRMRREDRLGEVDYKREKEDYERLQEKKKRSRFDV